MKQDFNFNLQEIDLDISQGKSIEIKKVVTHKSLELIKYKLDD